MTDILDTIPNKVRIRAAAGATLNVQVQLQLADGTQFDTTGGTAFSEILERAPNSAPSVDEFSVSLDTDTSIVSLSLSSSETTQLRGTWYYRVWVDLPGPARYLMCHGDLEVDNP